MIISQIGEFDNYFEAYLRDFNDLMDSLCQLNDRIISLCCFNVSDVQLNVFLLCMMLAL